MPVHTSRPSIASEYPEVKALCDHANTAANEARTIWFGYLSYGTFLLVAVSGTTHKMLFLETPISLPILSINLDLVGFYFAAPAILVVLHLYLLVKIVLLSECYANFEAQVARDIKLSSARIQIRKHLNTTIFVQAMKAQRQQRSLLKILLWLLLFLTLSAGPVFALFFTQIRFLPYQYEAVTWFHRVLIAFDLIVLLGAFEATFRNRGFDRPFLQRWLAYPISAALIGISIFMTFPGEWIDAKWLVKTGLPTRDFGTIHATDINWPFPTTLELANQQFVAEMKLELEKLQSTFNRGGKSLVGADLSNSDLRKMVFDGDNLQGASLNRASLQGASLNRARLQGASLIGASLQGASLDSASLQGASLNRARLQGASLNSTLLWRAYGAPRTGNLTLAWVKEPILEVLSKEQLAKMERNALHGVESKEVQQRIKQAIARLSLPENKLQGELPETYWTNLVGRLSLVDHQKYLAKRLQTLACDAGDAPYVAQGLMKGFFYTHPRLEDIGPDHLPGVARKLLDAAENKTGDCPGVKGLNSESIDQLREWAAKPDTKTQRKEK